MFDDMLTADGAALLGIFASIFILWLIQGIAFVMFSTKTYYGESSGGRFHWYWYFSPRGLVMLPLAICLFCVRMIAAYSVVVVIMQGKGFWLCLGFLVAYALSSLIKVPTKSEG